MNLSTFGGGYYKEFLGKTIIFSVYVFWIFMLKKCDENTKLFHSKLTQLFQTFALSSGFHGNFFPQNYFVKNLPIEECLKLT